MTMIETHDLSYVYKGGAQLNFPNLRLDKHAVILGPSGVGKTTLLHLLAGLLRPTTGNIKIKNEELSRLTKQRMDTYRGKNIGIVFQQHHSIKSLTVEENLQIIQKVGKQKIDNRFIARLISHLDLDIVARKRPIQLSQGQKQRLSIAMALVNKPAILLADEPTSSLDDDNCRKAIQLLLAEAAEVGSQLIAITHDRRVVDQFEQSITL